MLGGLSLSDFLARGQLTPGHAVTVLVPLLHDLHRVHALGLPHAPITTQALLVDASGRATLVDSGLQTALGATRTGSASPTSRWRSSPPQGSHRRGSPARSVPKRSRKPQNSSTRRASPRRSVGASAIDRQSDFEQLLSVAEVVLGAAPLPAAVLDPVTFELMRCAPHRLDDFAAFFEDWLFALAAPESLRPAHHFDWQNQSATALEEVDSDVDAVIADDRDQSRPRARLTRARAVLTALARKHGPILWHGLRTQKRIRPRTAITAVIVCVAALLGALTTMPATSNPPHAGNPPPAHNQPAASTPPHAGNPPPAHNQSADGIPPAASDPPARGTPPAAQMRSADVNASAAANRSAAGGPSAAGTPPAVGNPLASAKPPGASNPARH